MPELESAPRPPYTWHFGVREMDGLTREDADVFMSFEEYIGPDEIMVALLSVLDEDGFAGLPIGIYLVTDLQPEELNSDEPAVLRKIGDVMNYVTQSITRHATSRERIDVPEQITIETPLPPNVFVDVGNGFMLVYLEGTLGGYPIYDMRPMTSGEKTESIAMLPDMEIHLEK